MVSGSPFVNDRMNAPPPCLSPKDKLEIALSWMGRGDSLCGLVM